MKKRKINYQKFEEWLKARETESRSLAKRYADEGNYSTACDMVNDANTYDFILQCINDPEEMGAEFVEEEEDGND